MVALLGAGAVGHEFREVAGEPDRDAVLADASLRPYHLLTELPSREDDAAGVHRNAGRAGGARARERDRRGAAVVRRELQSAVPGGVSARRNANSRGRTG